MVKIVLNFRKHLEIPDERIATQITITKKDEENGPDGSSIRWEVECTGDNNRPCKYLFTEPGDAVNDELDASLDAREQISIHVNMHINIYQ